MSLSYLKLLPFEIQQIIALYAPYQCLIKISDMISPYFCTNEFLRLKAQITQLSQELLEAIRENRMDIVREMLHLDYKLNLLHPTERKQIIMSLIENNNDQIAEEIIGRVDPFLMDLSEIANTVGFMKKFNLMKILSEILNQFGDNPASQEIAAYALIGLMESQEQSHPVHKDVLTIAEIFHISPIDLYSSLEKINEVPDECMFL